jgi:arylsulfatase B
VSAPISAGPSSNGGWYPNEKHIPPAGGRKPHIAMILMDDYGWADSGWHRLDDHDPAADVMTPNMNALVKAGIEMDRQYVYKYCSPTRSAIQSGRNPYHVNPLNAAPNIYNPEDPVSGMAAIPRNMTGMAIKMSAAGYKTHMFGKWDAGMASPDHTPHGRGEEHIHSIADHVPQSACVG